MLRIAALMAAEAVTGPARQLAALAARLPEHGVAIHVLLTRRQTNGPVPFAALLARLGVPYSVVADNGPLDWRMVARVRSIMQRHAISLLQTHGYKASAIGFALHRGAHLPWIAFYHGATRKGLKDVLYQRLEQRLIRSADRIAIVAAGQAELFGDHSRKVVLINNAVLPTDLGDGGAALQLPEHERPAIGVIARLSHEKGVDVFLRACRLLLDDGRSFTAFIAGDGPELSALQRLAADLALGEHARFMGYVEGVAGMYPQLDLVVLPSRSEGLPNVLLEALAHDVPAVATYVGAVPDVLREPAAGLLVPPDDPAALAAAICAALDSGRSDESTRARRDAAARYSLDARLERHIQLYRELVRSPLSDGSCLAV